MKKIVSFLIAVTVLFGIGIATYFMVSQSRSSESYNVSVSSSSGGTINIKLDDKNYIITESLSNTYQVKHKSNIILTATSNDSYDFENWTINNKVFSSNSIIEISVSESKIIKANFKVKTISLTVTDNNNFNEEINFPINSNLLAYLNNNYSAPIGYEYSYLYNNEPITDNTVLSDSNSIVIVKNLLNYSLTFKLPAGYTFDGTNSTKTIEYNVENISSIEFPNLPASEQHYNLEWEKTELTINDVSKIDTINAIKNPINYTATLYLPDGYTFENDESSKNINYTILDTKLELPKISAQKHYSIYWGNYTLTYSSTPVEITGTVQETQYEVKFMNGSTQVGETQYYSISTKDSVSIQQPNLSLIEDNRYYNLSWAEFDLNSLTDIDVQLIKTAKEFKFMFKLPEGYTFENNNESTYAIMLTIDTVETATFPTLPEAKEHYTLKWQKESLTKDDLIDSSTIYQIIAEEIPNEYVATLKLPQGCTFEDGSNQKDVTYFYGDSTIVIPSNINVTAHYELSWSEYSLNNSDTPTIITATKSAINYTVTFVHNGVEYSKQTFSVENNSIKEPTCPSSNDINYIYVWQAYTHELKNYTVNSVKIELKSVHSVSFKFDYGYNTSDLKYYYNKIAYHNGTIYVLNKTNNAITTITLNQLANNLFKNVKCPDGSYCELYINNSYVSSVSALENKLTAILTGSVSTTIKLNYVEGE